MQMSIEERMDLEAACDRLTEKQRQALYLVCYNGYTQEQAAATLGIQQSAVSGLLSRAMNRIRDGIDAEIR